MRSEKGGLPIIFGFFLALLLLWGGSYLYFRQTRVATYYIFGGSGIIRLEKKNQIREIQYDHRSGIQTFLYYLHLPWHKLDVLVNHQAAPKIALREFSIHFPK